jgi:hypothetical protein
MDFHGQMIPLRGPALLARAFAPDWRAGQAASRAASRKHPMCHRDGSCPKLIQLFGQKAKMQSMVFTSS